MTTATGGTRTGARGDTARASGAAKAPHRPRHVVLYVFLSVMALIWIFPVFWAVLNSFRDYDFTSVHGYVSFGGYTMHNYADAWRQGDFGQHFLNSVIITVPAVVLVLLLASSTAFVLARFNYAFNLTLLGVFLAANLLPPQALLIPIFRLYRQIPLPEWLSDSGSLLGSYWGLILINVAFQLGFSTFVLSNYMKTVPKEIYESAEIDGASVWRQYWQLTLPLCRPALAALAVLQTTWVYNEFFWATVLIQDFKKLPITSSLNNLRGQFFVDYNLLSAGSVLVALPVLVVFFALQKQFVSGLTLGSTKG
jgi:multiple sugar transport system permease protein